MNLILILSSVFLNWLAQILLKLWMPNLNFKQNYLNIFFDIFTNLYVLWWLFAYWISILLWMYVLSKVDVSFAYPFLSLWFIFVMLTWMFWLWESVNIYKIIWMIFIVLWVFFIYKFW